VVVYLQGTLPIGVLEVRLAWGGGVRVGHFCLEYYIATAHQSQKDEQTPVSSGF
jgi:hypothetical protein